MQLTFDMKHDLKRFIAVGTLTTALVMSAVGTANAAPADRDGLTDAQEKIAKTSPTKADTDRDGIRDGDEDRDRDGVDNTNELMLGLAINDANSGNDALPDGEEDRDGNGIDGEDEYDTDEDD